tara:strand:+ start:232 stop:423 length:192 start_codon:yes stop_codon:yes gene_type:complete
MDERAFLLVHGPIPALTILGTIPSYAAALAAAIADQESWFGEIEGSLAAIGTDSTPQPGPVLP